DRLQQLFRRDKAMIAGDLLKARYLQPLPTLDRMHKFRCLEQTLRRPGVEPGVAAPENLDVNRAARQIYVVDISYFNFTPRRRLQRSRNFDHLVVVKIEPGHRPP